MSILNQLKLFGYVGSNLIRSPGYINQSIFDSLGSFASRYIAPKRDYYHLFDYYRWDENVINSLLLKEYNWETAIDTQSTWRIGDGTASFYNYIYLMIYSKSILILLKFLSPKIKPSFIFGLEETFVFLLIPHKGGGS